MGSGLGGEGLATTGGAFTLLLLLLLGPCFGILLAVGCGDGGWVAVGVGMDLVAPGGGGGGEVTLRTVPEGVQQKEITSMTRCGTAGARRVLMHGAW